MIKWKPFEYQGQVYDLSHLHPAMVDYLQPAQGGKPARKYNAQVIYSLHCFTRRKIDENTDAALHYRDLRECRIFDFTRYELSRQLPGIIASLITRQCYHTGHGNFFAMEIIAQNGEIQHYEVYFRAKRSGKGIITLHIESAYPTEKPSGASKKKKIAFHTILFNTLNNKPIRAPK